VVHNVLLAFQVLLQQDCGLLRSALALRGHKELKVSFCLARWPSAGEKTWGEDWTPWTVGKLDWRKMAMTAMSQMIKSGWRRPLMIETPHSNQKKPVIPRSKRPWNDPQFWEPNWKIHFHPLPALSKIFPDVGRHWILVQLGFRHISMCK
jgi:hypothetical protein